MFRQDGGDAGDAPDADLDDAANDGAGSADPGALCGASGRDDCGPYSACDAELGCVECRNDDDCPVAAGHCLLGACVGCRPAMTDCPSGTTCWTTDFECHPRCAGLGSCPDGTACDESSGACVGCSAEAPCATGVCSPDLRQCVECVSDETCPKARPRCLLARGECAACTSNEDCGVAAPICDPVTFECRTGCTSDAQCPGTTCDVATARCTAAAPADAGAVSDASSG